VSALRALDRKVLRELWEMRSQALAIALVIGCGVATFVMFRVTLESLQQTRTHFYRDYRFPEVFASLKRAPESLRARIAAIPGVRQVDTRVVAAVTVDVAGFPEPVTGLLTSVPDDGEPLLSRLYLFQGRSVEAGRDDEVVVSEAFARAHGFAPGDRLHVVVKGVRKALRIVGTAVSPEHVHQLRPGSVFPDFERYAVMWMARTPLGSAYDLEGAFNHVAIALHAGASAQGVIDRLDALLGRYGGIGAHGREDQPSHRFLDEEFKQLANLSGVFPVIFLGVAAFLLNVVVSRLVGTQREVIATLKAFGYSSGQVTRHYALLVSAIVGVGVVLGVASGGWLGRGLAVLYTRFFRLPYLEVTLSLPVLAQAVAVAAAAALAGTLVAVRLAARLRPAEGMRPESPAVYRRTLVERLGAERLLSQPSRMILRGLGRRPVKSALTVLGIALACGIMMTGRFQEDTVAFMLDVQFQLSQRQDLTVTFVEPTSRRVLHELTGLPGVAYAEPLRSVPVRLRSGHRSYRTGIEGIEPGGRLRRVLDRQMRELTVPPAGLLLTDYLGEILAVGPGDVVTVEVLEGSRPVREVPVAGLVSQYVGVAAYMDLEALGRWLREGPAVSGAFLATDPAHAAAVYRRLKDSPQVAGVVERDREVRNFRKMMEETMLLFVSVATFFAGVIAFGVVYNSARITLTERGRELASLRVLGFTRGEIAYILLGELGLLTLLALPLGFLVGRALCGYIAATAKTDLYRVPLVLEPDTYAFAALVVLVSAVVSGLVVRRRLDTLDLIAVLKTRE
jgi:putative ABC transport system permease protein